MDTVLTENDGFDPKRPETHFLPSRYGLSHIDLVSLFFFFFMEKCSWPNKNIFFNFKNFHILILDFCE